MNPGIYENLPAADYHAAPGASASRLKDLARSPAHCRHAMDNPGEPTEAMRFGTLVHALTLEPAAFDAAFVIPQKCEETKKDGKRCSNGGKFLVGGRWLCGIHVKADRHEVKLAATVADHRADGWTVERISDAGSHYLRRGDELLRISNHAASASSLFRMCRDGRRDLRVDLPPYSSDDPRTVVDADTFATAQIIADEVRAHPAARLLLDSRTATELSAVWTDPATGVLCKMRADMLCRHNGGVYLPDLKTTDDASEAGFWKAVANYRYDLSACHYMHGLAACGTAVDAVHLIMVEKAPPFAVGVYAIPSEVIEAAGEHRARLLELWATCERSGKWPAYSDDAVNPVPPAWFMRRRELELTY